MRHRLDQSIKPYQDRVLEHPLYTSIRTEEDVRDFMRFHIYAVWDFMSLLKELQRRFTNVERIWHPRPNARLCRMINEIVLGEEADKLDDGRIISHYDLYVSTMQEAGAWNAEFRDFYDYSTVSSKLSAEQLAPNSYVEHFLKQTFRAIDSSKDHELAAYFFFGREALIPDMFVKVVESLNASGKGFGELMVYLQRHIDVDGGEHGPIAARMLAELCGSDEKKWSEAAAAAVTALEARKVLWDGALAEIRNRTSPSRPAPISTISPVSLN
jgi:hypothetical protein